MKDFKDYETDLKELSKILKEEGIKYILKKHPVVELEPQVKDLIGYYPSGEWQIKIGNLSIIRGMVSYGDYELYDGADIIRTKTAEEMIKIIKKYNRKERK